MDSFTILLQLQLESGSTHPSLWRWLLGFWVLFLGGAIGSFLNVVIHRMPKGMSVIYPGSRCPQCEHAIRWYDNIPVISWFILQGRCRDCGTSFSIRYAAVEALVAAMFAVLGIAEALSDGANLPELLRDNIAGNGLGTLSSLVIYAYHLLLFCTLIGITLMHVDGNRGPLRMGVAIAAVGILLPLQWTALRPLHVAFLGDRWSTTPWLGLADGVAGMVVGIGFGWIVSLSELRADKSGAKFPGAMGVLTLCGVFLGWHAVMAIAFMAAATRLITLSVAGTSPIVRRIPVSAFVTAAAFAKVLYWGQILQRVPAWGPSASWKALGSAGLVVLFLALFSRRATSQIDVKEV